MKIKISITLSEDLLRDLEALGEGYRNRSEVVERALRFFIRKKMKDLREANDRKIIDAKADRLNEEAEDVLTYQGDI